MGAFGYFQGYVRIEVVCHSAERFLNICAENGIKFGQSEKINADVIRVTVTPKEYRILLVAAKKYGYEIKLIAAKGAKFTAQKLRKRYVLISGMILCIAAIFLSSMFVWEIEVTGNESVSDAEILAELDKIGIGIGTCRVNISQEYISNEMPQRIKELSFIAVNVTGSRAEVIVREEKAVPEMENGDIPRLIYAGKSGVITKMTVLEGTPLYNNGDTVSAGDILVSGVVGSVSSGDRLVSAGAEVYARTWYEMSAQMPAESYSKNYIGEENNRFSIILCGKRINLYFNGGNKEGSYDKIVTVNKWSINNVILPVQIVKETVKSYVPKPVKENVDTAVKTLKSGLVEQLENEIGEKGEIVKTTFSQENENGTITVTMCAECIERIDKTRELTEEEKVIIGKEDKSGGEVNQR